MEEDRFQLAVATTEQYSADLRREQQNILSLEEVAQWFSVSTRTIMRLVESGVLIGFHVGRSWRFERRDILGYMQQQREFMRERAPVARVLAEAEKHPEKIEAMIDALHHYQKVHV